MGLCGEYHESETVKHVLLFLRKIYSMQERLDRIAKRQDLGGLEGNVGCLLEWGVTNHGRKHCFFFCENLFFKLVFNPLKSGLFFYLCKCQIFGNIDANPFLLIYMEHKLRYHNEGDVKLSERAGSQRPLK